MTIHLRQFSILVIRGPCSIFHTTAATPFGQNGAIHCVRVYTLHTLWTMQFTYYAFLPAVAPTSPEDELSVMALRTRSTRRARTVATEAELKQRGKPIVKAKFTKFKAVVRAIMMMKSARSRVKSSAIMPYTKIRQSVSVAHPASATHKCGPRCRLEIKAVPTVVCPLTLYPSRRRTLRLVIVHPQISISACEDHQRSWEVDFDGDGSESIHSASSVSSNGSMTKVGLHSQSYSP